MSFDDPEENQDETTMPQLRPQKSVYSDQSDDQQASNQQNYGGNPEVVKGLMEMMKQYRTPPGPNGEYYKRVYPPMPEPEPEPTNGQKIMALAYPEGSPERERYWRPEKTLAEKIYEITRSGRNLPPPSRLQIVKDPNAIGGGPPWPEESQGIFRHFYPGMSEAELAGRSWTTQNSGSSARGGPSVSRRENNNPVLDSSGSTLQRSGMLQSQRGTQSHRFLQSTFGDDLQRQNLFTGAGRSEPPLLSANTIENTTLFGNTKASPEGTAFQELPNASYSRANETRYGNGPTAINEFGSYLLARQQGNAASDREGFYGLAKNLLSNEPNEGGAVDLQNPLGINIDSEVPGHMLPDNAGPELRELLKPERWKGVSQADKGQLAALMGTDISAANDYASAILNGKPRPRVSGNAGEVPYFGREVDDFVHSSVWVDGRLRPEEKATLTALIRNNDVKGANAFVRQLQRRFWYEDRYPQWANTVPGRLTQAAKIASAYQHNKQWIVETSKGFGRNTDKCNEFVADVLEEAGLEVPRIGGRLGSYNLGGPPSAAQWADASKRKIGHWEIVGGPPQPGDVIAELTDPAHPAYAHVGIVVGTGRTASASTLVYPKGMIVVNDWGFRQDELGKRVVRRYIP